MTGNNMNIGLRLVPDVKYSNAIPNAATSIAAGISHVSGLAGTCRGTSGGGSTTMSPASSCGALRRGAHTKSIGERTQQTPIPFHRKARELPHGHPVPVGYGGNTG